MNREILLRGKRTNNGEWTRDIYSVYGKKHISVGEL